MKFTDLPKPLTLVNQFYLSIISKMKKFTEKESVQYHKITISLLEQEIRNKKYIIPEISELLPCHLHVNAMTDQHFIPLFFDQGTLLKFNKSIEELKSEGINYLKSHLHPKSVQFQYDYLTNKLAGNNKMMVISYMEMAKFNSKDSEYIKFFKIKKIINKSAIPILLIRL